MAATYTDKHNWANGKND